jgi:hypothetical protein
MDDAYYRSPVGSAEHYAAYEKEFTAGGITPIDDPDIANDPRAMYEVDNAWELAYDRWVEEGAQQAAEEQSRWWADRGIQVADDLIDDPRGWLGDDWYQRSRHAEPDAEPEAGDWF